jgi:hypothetical protein
MLVMKKMLTLLSCLWGVPFAEVIAEPHYNVNDYYEVYQDGRIYVFDDFATYDSFNQVRETAFRLTRIGAGPAGETVVFGLQDKDKKMTQGIGSVDLFDGKAEGLADGFYAEIVRDGRFYVFNSWEDVKTFRLTGKAALRYTDIGAGPGGETVVYVLNESNKKQMPTALIEQFKKKHAL